jgi:hypothetical protein
MDAGGEGIRLTLALANWLTSVRWLLDHTEARLLGAPESLQRVKEAMSREFDAHFAYRFTCKLRDYITHCDLPPISIHVSSKFADAQRNDSLTHQFDPQAGALRAALGSLVVARMGGPDRALCRRFGCHAGSLGASGASARMEDQLTVSRAGQG